MTSAMTGNAIREALEPFAMCGDIDTLADAVIEAVTDTFDEGWQPRDAKDAVKRALEAAVSPVAVEEADYVLVPREPTEAMLKSAVETCGMPWLDAIPPHEDAEDFILRQAFRAMLAAAPSTHTAAGAGPVGEAVEIIAAALWKEEAREGTPKSVYEGRTLEAFREQSPETIYRWTRFARAAHAARPAEEPGEVERDDRLPIGHYVLEQADLMDGTGRVAQTVSIGPEGSADATEYQRIVHADEAYGEAQ